MECYNFLYLWEDFKFPIQIFELQESFFIYIGKENLSFENLSVCNFITGESSSNSHTLIDEHYSDIGKSLASKLGKILLIF